ncbi:MAG: N-formylglutamate amidohydrolase [Alphaproteobacteria bacterium]|nr:N-formylglutamate amidohydrolase [Alphaproteobacteria bacterium]
MSALDPDQSPTAEATSADALRSGARSDSGAPDGAPGAPPAELAGVYDILSPRLQDIPLVCASPHSGCDYSIAFRAQAQLDSLALRRSEDCYVDRIFAGAPTTGAPLLRALFPRAFVDANREPFELDPDMFEEALPAFVNRDSPRAAAGLGTVPRVVASGAAIYGGKLRFADAEARVAAYYRPYHAALRRLVDATRGRFGLAVVLDCHSMPSAGAPTARITRSIIGPAPAVDVVLGDCHGASCAPELTDAAESLLRAMGYSVARNNPYAGGYTTRHYGAPEAGVHALQVEINRALYMDEATLEPAASLSLLGLHMTRLVAALGDVATDLARRG